MGRALQGSIEPLLLRALASRLQCNGGWSVDFRKHITIEPGKRGGKPCIRGLRITVADILDYLAAGLSVDAIVKEHPSLTPDDIHAALAYSADLQRKLAAGLAA